MLLTILFVLLVTEIGASHHGALQLDYARQNEWGGVCTTGQKQSPIDIPDTADVNIDTQESIINLPNKLNMTNLDNNNTVKFAAPEGTTTQLGWISSSGGSNRQVTLHQFHLHWGHTYIEGSEHRLGGTHYSAEAHLVTSYTIAEGETRYMVFARLFEIGEDNKQIGRMIEAQKSTKNRDINNFDLAAIYPSDTSAWYTYEGSFTTPNCNEITHWVVARDTLTVSDNQLKELRGLNLGSSKSAPLDRNWRNLQERNGRIITMFALERTEMVPNDAVDMVPNDAVDMVPNDAVDMIPNDAVDMIPNDAVDMIPNDAVDMVPNDAVDVLPNLPVAEDSTEEEDSYRSYPILAISEVFKLIRGIVNLFYV